MKLFTRYNRINVTVMIALFLLSGICYYFLINYLLIHELDEALEDYHYRIENYVQKHGELPPIGQIDDTRIKYILSDEDQESNFANVVFVDSLAMRSHNYRQYAYFQKTGKGDFQVILAKPIEGTKLLSRTVVGVTIAMLLTVIMTSTFLNFVILSKLWQPFYNSLSSIRNFKLGKKKLPDFPATDIEEFAYMNQLLKDTIINAEAEYQILKEFTENASHEIQTPLAIIRSKLDLVIQEEGLSEKQTEALKSIYSGIKRLTKLSQSLLLLTKIENQQFSQLASVNLKEKTEEKLNQFQEFWQNNDIGVHADLETSVIQANPELIDILLSNLISNAGRHNSSGGTISMRLREKEFLIENSGPHTALDSTRLFRRFYKEAQHSQHNGLGLSIVKQICDQLGITISYEFADSAHRFTLTWK